MVYQWCDYIINNKFRWADAFSCESATIYLDEEIETVSARQSGPSSGCGTRTLYAVGQCSL